MGNNMKYAIIENGVVTNVALADSPLASNWVASDAASIGWAYDGANFTAPAVYVPTLAERRAEMRCSRAQGKTVIGAVVWAQVTALADDPGTLWGLKVIIHDTYEWSRTDPNMDALIWAMGMTPTEADDLFTAAMNLL
jgi:hypothetical protein